MALPRYVSMAHIFGLTYCQLLRIRSYQRLSLKYICKQTSGHHLSVIAPTSTRAHTSFPQYFLWTAVAVSCRARTYSTDNSGNIIFEDDELQSLDKDREEMQFLREICSIPDSGHHVMVIQPAVKWGPRKSKVTTPELQLSETCALVSTLPRWKVVRKRIVPVKQPNSATIFGSGTYQQLSREICGSRDVSAVVLGVDILSGIQLTELRNSWKIPVYDRYAIVLQIFKDHARTKEAKLQVALAEIPYIRSRLSQFQDGDHDHQVGGAHLAGGTGETYMGRRRLILQDRETKLRKALGMVKNQRSRLRLNRQRSDIPTVAVVGYTNSGKTTLIKALTGDDKMQPKDQLFATLDVTAHAGRLPSNMTVIFMDTVGFICDIPVALIDAFSATLEDAVLADLVIHVRDVSHPDTVAQKLNVLNTLGRMLSREQLSSMIEVCNKVDKMAQGQEEIPSGSIATSAVTGQGLKELQQRIQDCVIKASGHLEKTFRIPMQGPMLAWLYKEATVRSARACDDNPEYLLVEVIMTSAAYQRFQAVFSNQSSSAKGKR